MRKNPKTRSDNPTFGKIPRVAPEVQGEKYPTWRVGKLDFGGPWCPKAMTSAVIEDVIFRLKELESMTWTEIEQGTHSHFVEVTKLIPDAQKRLSALRLDDFDVLFSLRIKAKPRLWGIRINNIFHALWWDPDHQVCPSLKKHT